MLDVGLDLLGVERAEVIAGKHSLAQLLGVATGEDVAELRLSQKKGLQRRTVSNRQICQHAQLFQSREGQVLRLVDNQQGALPGDTIGTKELRQRTQHALFVAAGSLQTKARDDDPEKIGWRELRRRYLGGDILAGVQLLPDMLDERRLARPDLAGDHHEPVALAQPISYMRQRLAMRLAAKEEASVRCQAER